MANSEILVAMAKRMYLGGRSLFAVRRLINMIHRKNIVGPAEYRRRPIREQYIYILQNYPFEMLHSPLKRDGMIDFS
jgi:hypothetical protein